MSHVIIFKQFTKHFPVWADQVKEWFPNGKNSIRVRLTVNTCYIFTWNGIEDWCLETVDSYIKNMKGE